MDEKILDLAEGGSFTEDQLLQERATDPVISNAGTPGDFAAQFPNPLDPNEIIAMCEEITAWREIPEETTGLKVITWRELNELEFNSGSSYIAFSDGACPEEFEHDGDNETVTLKNIGAKKSLNITDIMHSVASQNMGDAIRNLVGGFGSSEGMPGGYDMGTFYQQSIADLKEKEVRLAMTLVMNGWDRLLITGDSGTNSLEFDGIENWATNNSCSFHTNSHEYSSSGSFSASSFDRFLSEACAKPQAIFGHPQAIQEMMAAYMQLGASGMQVVNYNDGNRLVPGFNYAGYVNTGIGRLKVVADNNFTKTASGTGSFVSDLYTLRMTQNGEPLVYKATQIPLALKDLVPGCTAISFMVWAKTALVIKHCCAQGKYTGFFTGRASVTTCPVIG